MKIIVMSDSHGDVTAIQKIGALQADAHFHCGDSELPFTTDVFGNMHKVRGNCDRDFEFPDEVIVTIGDKKVFMVHGHLHSVKNSLMSMSYEAQEKGAKLAFFGHSHLYGAEMQDGILFVNPGSTLLPRGGNRATYAVIEWDEKITVTFKDMADEVVECLVFEEN